MKNIYSTIILLILSNVAFGQLGGGSNHPTCEQEGFPPGTTRWFRDADGDQKGDDNVTTCASSKPNIGGYNWVQDNGDCDDTDANLPTNNYWADADGDGYGDPGTKGGFILCTIPNGYVTNGNDCDDTPGSGANIYPGAPEICDGLDNDCDGQIDENIVAIPSNVEVIPSGCGQVTLTHNGPSTWYWQTANDGISESDNSNSRIVNTGSVLYLRAKSGICWSNALEVTFSTVQPTINEPGVTGNTERCGNGNVSITPTYLVSNGSPTATSFKWYNSSGSLIDETNVAESKTFALSQANTNYQVAAVVAGCTGPRKDITLKVNSLPSAPSMSVNQSCDMTTVSMLNPPTSSSDIKWYWQTSASGDSQSDNVTSKNFTTAGNIYLRSYNEATGCWGSSAQESFTVINTPQVPDLQDISISQNCGTVTLSYNNNDVPANVDWYWQSSGSGSNTGSAASNNSVELSSGDTYFIRAKRGNCWSTPLSIGYSINSNGILSPNITSAEQNQSVCGSGTFYYNPSYLTLNGENGPSHYVWFNSSDIQIDEVAVGTPFSRTLSSTTTLKVAAKIDGCIGSKTIVTANVGSLPSDLTLASAINQITENCGQTVITRNNPPSGTKWFWQNNSDGIDDSGSAEQATIAFSNSGSHFLRPRNETTQCWGDALEIGYTVKQAPLTPITSVNVVQNCGSVTLTRTNNPPVGVTWYWQDDQLGEDIADNLDDSSIDLGSGTSYYLRAFSNGCWSDQALEVNYNILSGGVVAPTVDAISRCGEGEIVLFPVYEGLHDPNDNDISYNFYDTSSELIANVVYGASFTETITVTTNYTVRAQSNGCEGPSTSVTATINIPDTVYYYDGDGDGLGDPFTPSNLFCDEAPDNYVADNSDNCPYLNDSTNTCDDNVDSNATHNPDNYIYTRTYQSAGIPSSPFFTPSDNLIQEITYFDGLGRPRQQIGIDQTPDKNDLITHVDFDAFNRPDREWLSYPETSGTIASYRSNAKDNTETWYVDEDNYGDELSDAAPNPFSQKYFELSPLNRVLKQGAPGEAWLVNPSGSDNTIEFEYQSNAIDEVRMYQVTTNNTADENTFEPTLVEDGYYPAAELTKMVTKDENHTSGNDHTTEEFTDKNGRVILKRTYNAGENHDTYYVYDDFGNLSFVIPPLVNTADGISAIELNELCYQYTYDHRNRLVIKQIPGKEKEYIIYNKLDQPIMTQDPNQRVNNEWLFTKYDAFGRVAYTGKAVDSQSRKDIQNEVNGLQDDLWVERGSFNNGSININYSNTAYPTTTVTEVLTVNYYDDYGFDTVNEPTPPTTIFDEDIDNRTKGLATGSKVRVLGSDDWITTIIRYDNKGRVIYTYSENEFFGSVDVVTSDLDFVGRPVTVRAAHTKGATNVVTLDNFTYDHVGRLLTQTQCIGDDTLGNTCPSGGGSGTTVQAILPLSGNITTDQLATQSITVSGTATISGTVTLSIDPNANNGNNSGQELIVSNSYDELGQLIEKNVGGDATGNGLQTIDYGYNIRGWMTNINADNNNDNDLFNFELKYNDPTNFGADENPLALYNGNISQALWDTQSVNIGDNPVSNRYSYSYDALNRITGGFDNTGNYNLTNVSYDKNGNIKGLIREAVGGTKDNLTYNYHENEVSNRLQSLADASNNADGFNDRQTNLEEYGYDDNGNMTRDDNKGITNIEYNYLNLPTRIFISNNDHNGDIRYIYDATGVKLQKSMFGGEITDYVGNFIYESGNLQFFSTPEGYVTDNGSGNYDYVYQYKDHLGNIRLSYTDADNNGSIDASSEIIKESNYYPFGLSHKGYNGNVSSLGNSIAKKYMFGGKEYQDELDLGWYDITARNYDPALGRWMNLDPLAEQMRRHSPYNYAFDNPVFFIDPDGMKPFANQGPCGDKPCPETNFFQRAANTLTDFFDGIAGLVDNQTFGKEETNQKLSETTNGVDRVKLVKGQLTEMSDAMKKSSDAAVDGAKGGVGAIADVADNVADKVSDVSDDVTVLSLGATAPVTVPLSKGADVVSTTSKVVKGTIHASDGNDAAAAKEFMGAASNIISDKIVDKVSKHVEKVGGIDNKTQKAVQESVFSRVLDWFSTTFEF